MSCYKNRYHQEGETRQAFPESTAKETWQEARVRVREREGLKCFKEPGVGRGAGGHSDCHYTRPRSRGAKRDTRDLLTQATEPRSRSPPILRGRLPFSLPGCLARSSPHSFSRPPPPSRPLRQDPSPSGSPAGRPPLTSR